MMMRRGNVKVGPYVRKRRGKRGVENVRGYEYERALTYGKGKQTKKRHLNESDQRLLEEMEKERHPTPPPPPPRPPNTVCLDGEKLYKGWKQEEFAEKYQAEMTQDNPFESGVHTGVALHAKKEADGVKKMLDKRK